MIHLVVLAFLYVRRGAKVHSVRLAHALDSFVVACQAENIGMEFDQVLFQYLGCVARGVAGDHYGGEGIAALGHDLVVHQGHFVELVGADVRAVSEAEIDLDSVNKFLRNAERVFPMLFQSQARCSELLDIAKRMQRSQHTSVYFPSKSSLVNFFP